MLTTTRIAATETAQSAQRITQSWLARFFSRPKRVSEVSEEKQRKALQELLAALSDVFFSGFAEIVTEQPEFSDSADDKASVRQAALKSISTALEMNIGAHLGAPSTQDVLQVIIGHYRKMLYPYIPFSALMETLQEVFPHSQADLKSLARSPRAETQPKSLSPELRDVVACIVRALQDVAIVSPPKYYISVAVHSDAKASLMTLLQALETLRKRYMLSTAKIPVPNVRPLGEALRELNLQIAIADRYIWLPLKELVAAPLISPGDLQLYARDNEEVEILANQISKGDGVFLITGYRGVGKSTFIYQALSKLSSEEYQNDEHAWQVIPILVSLAKSSGVTGILRLCIRRIYETLLTESKDPPTDAIASLTKGVSKLLTKDEREHLFFAYLRAVYKVNIQHGDSVKTLKQAGLEAGLNLNLGNFLSPIVGKLAAGALPTFGLNAKTSKEWAREVDTLIALPDYDEDKAEEDIIRLIKMLASPQKVARGNMHIKLAFIFDEMDKMETTEQEELVKQLKNLFLERHTIFLLVTSKEFYYRWLDEQRLEDAVLGSYFSWIKIVPLFTSKETTLMLERLVQLDASHGSISEQEHIFLTNLALYLTHKARGVPRDIIRELQTMRLWLRDNRQAYLTDRFEQYPVILVYAEIQKVLEGLFDSTGPLASPSTASGTALSEAPIRTSSAAGVDTVLISEHVWTNEGRKEQARRGLYIIVEELFLRGSLELKPDADVFQQIVKDNFKMVLPGEFELLLDRLAQRLAAARLRVGPDTPLASCFPNYTQNTELELCLLPSSTASTPTSTVSTLVVSPNFYTITRRRPLVDSANAPASAGHTLSVKEIEALLKENEEVKRQGAINALRQDRPQMTQGIYDQLCHIFIAEQSLALRSSIIGLQGATFFEAVRHLDLALLSSFIDTETDSRLLQEFVRLIRVCTDAGQNNYAYGISLLLQLLSRQTKALAEDLKSAQSQSNSILDLRGVGLRFQLLPESPLNDAISLLANIADQDILEQVIQALDPRKDIPSALQFSLKTFEAKSSQNLIELLVKHGFTSVSQEAWRVLLRDRNYEQLMRLWEHFIQEKRQKGAQDALIALLQLPSILKSQDQEQNLVLAWLNGPTWDSFDQTIINAVKVADHRLAYQLQRLVESEKQDRVADSVLPKQPPVAPDSSEAVSSTPTTEQQQDRRRGRAWLATLSALTIIVIYFVIPFDIPRNAPPLTHLMIRLLEELYVYGAIGCLFCCLSLIVLKDDRAFWAWFLLVVGVITGASAFVQIHFFPFTPTVAGQVWVVVLLILAIVTPGVIFSLMKTSATAKLSETKSPSA